MKTAEILERLFGRGACDKTILLEGVEPSGRVRFAVVDKDGTTERCGVTAAEITLPEDLLQGYAKRAFLRELSQLGPLASVESNVNRATGTTPTSDPNVPTDFPFTLGKPRSPFHRNG